MLVIGHSVSLDSLDVNFSHPAVYAILGCALFVLITGLVVSSCLIYGAAKERKGFVLPWLIYDGILLCVSVILIITVAVIAKEAAYTGSVISLSEYLFCVCG